MPLKRSKLGLKVMWKQFILELNKNIANKCVVCICHRILAVNLKFDTLDRIKEEINVVVILRDGHLLDCTNFGIHVHFVMRSKAPKDESQDGHAIHLFVEPTQIRPSVFLVLTFNHFASIIREH
jgi:hypothetical protein